MSDSFNPERKSVCLKKQNLFGSGYAGLTHRAASGGALTARELWFGGTWLPPQFALTLALR
jgi:hypothetical protein